MRERLVAEGKMQMFFDHVEYRVSEYRNSFKFYSACLIPLGFKLTTDNEEKGIFGFGLSSTFALFWRGN